MKQAHRKAIIAALAGAGLLAGNIAFGATDYMEREVAQRGISRAKTHISQNQQGKVKKTARGKRLHHE